MLEIFWKKFSSLNFFFNIFVVICFFFDLGICFRRFWEEFFLNVGKNVDYFFAEISIIMGEGLRLPTGAVPLDPACYWIEDSSRSNCKRSTAFQQKSLPFYLFKNFFLSWNRLKRMLKFLFRILTKKNVKKKIFSTKLFRKIFELFFRDFFINIYFRLKIVWNVY